MAIWAPAEVELFSAKIGHFLVVLFIQLQKKTKNVPTLILHGIFT